MGSSSGSVPKTYSFGPEFQVRLLALMCRNGEVLVQYGDLIEPQYFENRGHQRVCAIIQTYRQRYNRPPTTGAVREEIRRLHSQHEQEMCSTTVSQMERDSLSDADYLLERVVEFAKHQAAATAILRSLDHLERGEFEQIEKEMAAALRVGMGRDIGSFYFDETEKRLALRHQFQRRPIPTYIPDLDRCLNGGIKPKELGVWMAPPGFGKSIALVNTGRWAVISGRKVVHYTVEMGQRQIETRYDSCFSALNYRQLVNDPRTSPILRSKLEYTQRMFRGNLVVKEFPTRGASVRDLEAHFARLEGMNFRPDLVLVDYGDIMLSTHRFENRRDEEGRVFEELRGMAMRLDIPLWTGTQTNRAALSKRTITIADVGESFDKVRIADIVIAICEDEADRQQGKRRLFVAKNRDGQAYQTVDIYPDFATMQFARRL